MTDTLFDAVVGVARLLDMFTGTATGGSTTTIIDTTLLTQSDDYWNQGTAFIITDAGGASAAPEGEWGRITDFDNATSKATISAVTAAVAAGDIYGLLPARFNLDKIRNAINAYLTGLKIPKYDITSLDTAANQTEYTLPAAVTSNNLRRVWVETVTDDANDHQWSQVRQAMVIRTGTGVQDILVIPQYASDRDIMLEYVATHPALYDADDSIDESVHLNRIIFRALEFIFANEITWRDSYQNSAQMANFYADKARQAEADHPIHLPPLDGMIVSYPYDGITSNLPEVGDIGKVSLK